MKTDESSSRIVLAFIDLPFLLDTSAAILLRDDDPAAKAALANLDAIPALSAVTKVELEGGVYVRPEMMAQRRLRLDALLEVFEVIDFSSQMASIYAQIVSHSGYSRRMIIDRMIAATALHLDLTLITTNGKDFVNIDGLKLKVWNP